MIARTISFDNELFQWLEKTSAEKGITLSALVHQIVQKYRKILPEIKKQEELRKFREAAGVLFNECEIPQEALISWLVEVSGGCK